MIICPSAGAGDGLQLSPGLQCCTEGGLYSQPSLPGQSAHSQASTVQYSTVQYIAVQYCTVPIVISSRLPGPVGPQCGPVSVLLSSTDMSTPSSLVSGTTHWPDGRGHTDTMRSADTIFRLQNIQTSCIFQCISQ